MTPDECADTGLSWTVPHATMLRWLADAGRYQWLKQQFEHTTSLGLDASTRWYLPVALLLRESGPDLDTVIDTARRRATQDAGSRIWIGEDPH